MGQNPNFLLALLGKEDEGQKGDHITEIGEEYGKR
jgi:hypothetical protein